MGTRTRWGVLTLALLLGACDQTTAGQPTTSQLDAYCAVARRDDLSTWMGDVLTLCQTDGSQSSVTCRAARPASQGVDTIQLDVADVLRVMPAAGGRFVVLGSDNRLSVLRPDGSQEQELAPWATDPWVSDDGERVAWIGLPDGVDTWDFGVPTVVVVEDLRSGGPTVLAEDELASTPRPVPGTHDVLYVSAQTGLASFWIAGPDRPAEQLTNIGQTEIGQDTVPVADREITWDDGALFYSVPGTDPGTVPSLWRLDVDAASAGQLGPGSWPQPHAGSIVALDPNADACADVYTNGGAP